ncbi:hypothetical protein J6590_013553 [Homalodisca vitripennis]|nr:hypothetical protein J6590_013553 [Homalodisca vitripennis]
MQRQSVCFDSRSLIKANKKAEEAMKKAEQDMRRARVFERSKRKLEGLKDEEKTYGTRINETN